MFRNSSLKRISTYTLNNFLVNSGRLNVQQIISRGDGVLEENDSDWAPFTYFRNM